MRKGYFTPQVLIILTIIIFAVAILIAINTDLVKRLKKEPPPTPISSSSPTSDASREPTGSTETANWRTYTNSALRYSFKYPANWVLETHTAKYTDLSFDENQPLQNQYYEYLKGADGKRLLAIYSFPPLYGCGYAPPEKSKTAFVEVGNEKLSKNNWCGDDEYIFQGITEDGYKIQIHVYFIQTSNPDLERNGREILRSLMGVTNIR